MGDDQLFVITMRVRSLLAATAVVTVLFYGFSGHSVPHISHDGMAGATVGLCLLLVTALGYAAIRRPERSRAVVVSAGAPYVRRSPLMLLDGRTRASPSVLSRFRN